MHCGILKSICGLYQLEAGTSSPTQVWQHQMSPDTDCSWLRKTALKRLPSWLSSLSQFSSVQFSCSVMSDSLWPHGLQHARPPCPLPACRACSNSCPLSQWCHPTISSSVMSPSPPAFNLSQHQGLFKWVSFSHQVAKLLELQLQPQSFQWILRISFRMDRLDLLAVLAVQRTFKSLLQHHSSKASILQRSAFCLVQLSHPCMTTGETITLTI